MKNAKFIIGLQVLFLAVTLVFSTSAVCPTGKQAPSAATNLALMQKGYTVELADHEVFQVKQGIMHELEKAADTLKSGNIPEDWKVLVEADKEAGKAAIYLVPIISGKRAFLMVMAEDPNTDLNSIGVEKDEDFSSPEKLGVYVGYPPAKPIEDIIAADKTKASGAGLSIDDTAALISQMSDDRREVRIATAHNLVESGLKLIPSQVLPALIKLLEDNDPSVREDAATLINRMGYDVILPEKGGRDGVSVEIKASPAGTTTDYVRGMVNRLLTSSDSNELAFTTAALTLEGVDIIPLLFEASKDADRTRLGHIRDVFAAITSKPGSVEEIESRIGDISSQIGVLESRLEETTHKQQAAYEANMDNPLGIGSTGMPSDYSEAGAKAVRLENAISNLKLKQAAFERALIMLEASTPKPFLDGTGSISTELHSMPVKASASGITDEHKALLSTITSGRADSGMLKEISAKLADIESSYRRLAAESEAALNREQAEYNMQYAKDTITILETALDVEQIPQVSEPFNLLLDRNSFPSKQLKMAEDIGEIAQIEQTLNCNVVITDANNIPAGLSPVNSIALTSNPGAFQKAGSRAIDINQIQEDRYLPLAPLSIFAKAMLVVNKDMPNIGTIKSVISNIYKSLTGASLPTTILEQYIQNPANFIVSLVLPDIGIVYQEGELEDLHMQATETLRAA